MRFENNTFDLKGGRPAGFTGLSPFRDITVSPATPGAGSQVIGNSFINLSSSGNDEAILFYGYRNAIVSNNRFSCESPFDCQGAIRFSNSSCSGTGCNQFNLIFGNMSIDLIDDGTHCPILLSDAGSADDPADNIVRGNVFQLDSSSASGATGICGNTAQNIVESNNAFGAP